MIRVGVGKPRMWFEEGHNDMSHYTPSHWETNGFFYMDAKDYLEKKEFEEFDMEDKNLSPDEMARTLEKVGRKEPLDPVTEPWGYKMNGLIKKSGGMIWQFNAMNERMDGYVRQAAVIGKKQLVRWTWFDAYVRLPALRARARALNLLNEPRAAKEMSEWERHLDEVYKETKR